MQFLPFEFTKLIFLLVVIVGLLPSELLACFGGRVYTSWDAQYCRNNVNYCTSEACKLVAQYTPPGCSDPRIREEVRRRISTCYNLNECFSRPITIGCTTTLSDCPMKHMCRQGQCWPSKVEGFYCNSDSDCRNDGVYNCVERQCSIIPYGSSTGNQNSWPNNNNNNNKWQTANNNNNNQWTNNNNQGSSGGDDDRNSCNGDFQCPEFQLCRQGKCYKTSLRSVVCKTSQDCPYGVYNCIGGKCQL